MILRALTLWRPWPWAMTFGSKRIENRPARSAALLRAHEGERIALHAGLRWDEPGRVLITSNDRWCPIDDADHPTGIVAIVRISRTFSSADQCPLDQRRWFGGPWATVFDDVIPIAPVRCKGAQGLWRVPDDAVEEIIQRGWSGT